MYYYPAFISSILLKYFFKKNVLSRKIMELHNNMDDLYELCNDVYSTGEELKVRMPLFCEKSRYFLNKNINQG
jgi:hypothetical protein